MRGTRSVSSLSLRWQQAGILGRVPYHYCMSFLSHIPPTNIPQLNTSTLGNGIVPTSAPASGSTPSLGSIFGSIARDLRSSIGGEIGSGLDSAIGDVANKLAGALGIQQWYSMHLMGMCEGSYTPDATVPHAQLKVLSCTKPTAMCTYCLHRVITSPNSIPDHFDISDQLSKELQLGTLHLDLSAIGWPSDIQNGLDNMSTALNAIFVLYAVGTAATSLIILATVIKLVVRTSRVASLGNWSLLCLPFLSLLIASAIATIVQMKAVGVINKYGNGIGLYAYRGDKYLLLTWAAVVVMFMAAATEIIIGRNDIKNEYTRGLGRGLKAFGRR
jgi:hypothetical protein